jgi:hypothetical protein
MSAPAPARANRDGHPCPPWCVTDHEKVHGVAGTLGFHGGPPVTIEVPGKKTSLPDLIEARAIHTGSPRDDREPSVDVAAVRHGRVANSHLWVSPRDAEDLAVIVELLADTSPDDHRELAAAIRKAAADIKEARDAQ